MGVNWHRSLIYVPTLPNTGLYVYNDVLKWNFFPRYLPGSLALCEGNSPVTGESPSQRPVAWSLDVFFDLPEQTVVQTIETPVIWDAFALIMTSLLCTQFVKLLTPRKMHILRCMGSTTFCVKFQRVPLKIHIKIWTHTPQNMHFTDFKWFTISLDSGFYIKGRPLVKSNLICPSDKLSWQPGCPILNINIQGNFCISQGNGSSDNLPENLV